ncbi:MAG: hypothetical protein BWX97_01881 [Firmicutes bacterium ADurb.Bin146]|nr:MAG: hypothetical protein BWX97_01881 [Firmicutes bacterium ADurb.Bin146]
MNDLRYNFSCIDFLNPNEKYRLYMACNNIFDIYKMNKDELHNISLLSNVSFDKLDMIRKIDFLEYRIFNNDIKITDIYSEDYPKILKYTYGAPIVLYYIGTLPKNSMVSVVGSRNPSDYGIRCAKNISCKLSLQGYIIVSGMARGIDGISHIAALESGISVGVLGNGIDICYPYDNKHIYKMLYNKGCLISEYPPQSSPKKKNFPQRNRIISGLSFCTIIVEASNKSGSLITANCALSQNRDVYCFPNYIDNGYNGTNLLIKEGAGVITDVDLFCQELKTIEINWKNIYYCKDS